MTSAQLIDKVGGVARGIHLQKFGYSRWMLARDVRDGAIRRLRPGVFAIPGADDDIVTAATHGGALTCLRALQMYGIWTLGENATVHVWLGGTARVHHNGCGCVSHYFTGSTRLGLAPLTEVLVHVFHCAGEESFFAALESALRQGMITPAERAGLRGRLPISGRWLVDFARHDADSGLESLLRLRLHRRGLTLDSQVRIVGVGRVDFVIAGRLILEADGRDNHDGASRRHKDLRRDAVASRLGYETLRFDYALIMHDWELVEPAILAAVARLRD